VTQYAYANNHYAGFAPATIDQFRQLCAEKEIETPLHAQAPIPAERMLFDGL
jgi:hypothetical protein